MTVLGKINAKARRNARTGNANRERNRGGVFAHTRLGVDMHRLERDLTTRQLRAVIQKMNTVVRKETVKRIKKASSAGNIGMSQYGKMTRGRWRDSRVTKDGVPYLPNGWYGDVLRKRGAMKPTMAINGGEASRGGGGRGGKQGIISRTVHTKNGLRGIVGPRYGTDAKDNSKYGYNYAHILEFGSQNHKAWNHKSRGIKPRPFLGPAGNNSFPKQRKIVTDALIKWGKGQ